MVVALPPAEAMRPESPPQFTRARRTFGVGRLFSISTRMILRNLERRPWKAILTVVGMSFAVAILIVGFYFFDAIEYLVQVQFRTAQRDDVTISLAEPHGEQARYDVTILRVCCIRSRSESCLRGYASGIAQNGLACRDWNPTAIFAAW